jgi:ribosomal protein S18 acetylase RimI-like enzyme
MKTIINEHNKVFIKQLDDETLHMISHGEHACFYVYENERIIASLLVYIKEGVGHIDHLFVHKDYQNKNMGKALMNQCMLYLNKHFISHVELEVWSANKRAMHFYHKLGFEVVKRTEFYLGKYI